MLGPWAVLSPADIFTLPIVNNTNADIIEDDEAYFNIRNTYSFILKIIFTCIALMIMPFIANKFFEMGATKFISGIGGMFISYFIVNILWTFL